VKGNKLLMMITALTAWFALGLQQYILIDNTPGNGMTPSEAVGRFLLFFTVLSNLLVAISLTIVLLSPASATARFFTKPSSPAAIALYIFIVGLVYNIILRSQWQPQGLQKIADELLHVAVPILYITWWLLFAGKHSLQWMDSIKWLAYPAVYLVYALVRGSLEGFYPYPFIDVTQWGAGQVAFNCAGLLIVFVIAGLLFVFIGKKMSRQTVNA
jgi:hypothetical protein